MLVNLRMALGAWFAAIAVLTPASHADPQCRANELNDAGEPKNTCLLRLLQENQRHILKLEEKLIKCAACECATTIAPEPQPLIKDTCAGRVLGSSCYEVVQTQMTWQAASAYCKEAGGHLADISSKQEDKLLVTMMQDLNDHVWLDGTDRESEGTWKWSTSGAVIGSNGAYTNWGPNEPNGRADDEDCMNLRRTTDQWNDSTCSDKESFICEYKYIAVQ